MATVARYTVLITDLVDSTKLAQELGDQRVVEVWLKHDRMARDLLPLHHGREIDKSDGFLLLFERALDGIRYALAYHQGLAALSEELGLRLVARAGLHEGEVSVIRTPEADVARGAKQWEVEGLAKPTAARIMSVALGGQTLLSGSTREALPEDTGDIRLISHGFYRMKGVAEPIELFEAGRSDAPLQPPPDAPKVYRVVPQGSSWRPAREVPNNLAPERVGFFGRSTELRAVADAFEGGARLVTLGGPGGTGKTTVAQRYAAAWLGDWPGGAWFCDLADARSPIDIARSVGAALGVPLAGEDPVETLGSALAARGSALVILDNFENVIRHARATVGRWLDLAPQAALLVTSRQRLGLRGERVLPLEPLPLPLPDASPAALETNPATQLFLDRARAVQPSFSADAAQLSAIAQLVRLLDGLPLAIELAAARVRVLPPQAILERMGRRFDLLKGGVGSASKRQGTLRGTIDWSWDLLEPHARAALAWCAVFEGGFDLEAAEAVLDLSAFPDAPWPMDVVEALVEQNLLRATPDPEGRTRFSLFQSIHDYAREKLSDPQAVVVDGLPVTGPVARQAAETRHAAWFARWGDREIAETLYRGRAVRRRLEAELENVVAAARRSAAAGDGATSARAALGALALLASSGPFALALALGEAAIRAAPPPELALRVAVELGVVRNRAGQPGDARGPLESALEASKNLGNRQLEADALAALGHGAVLGGALEEARQRFESALVLQRAVGDARGAAASLTELAHVIGIRGGQFSEARALLDTALAEYARIGDEAGEAQTRSYLGALCAIQGDFAQGRDAYTRARDLAAELGDRRTEGLSEGMIAGIATLTGDLAAARHHFEAALRIQSSIGDRVHEAIHAANYANLLIRMGEREQARALLTRAVALARSNRDPMTEGDALGALGALCAADGDLQTGLAHLAAGEARLREAGDRAALARLLCSAGEVELRAGQPESARARLDEASRIAAELSLGEGSELNEAIRGLRAASDLNH